MEIKLISEIETCVYEIHINDNSICNVPNFNNIAKVNEITCNPVLTPETYEKYMRKLNELVQKDQEELVAEKEYLKEESRSGSPIVNGEIESLESLI
jgi:hypothetical protein